MLLSDSSFTLSSTRVSASSFSFFNFDWKWFISLLPMSLHSSCHNSLYPVLFMLLKICVFSSLDDWLCFGLHVLSLEARHILLRSNWITILWKKFLQHALCSSAKSSIIASLSFESMPRILVGLLLGWNLTLR